MKIELVEEIKATTGTMYAVRKDGDTIKWFAKKEEADKFYNAVIADPNILNNVENILKSHEIEVSLPLSNQ